MIVYFLLAFLTAILTIVVKKKYQILFSFIIILIMFLLCGLRGINIGIDTKEYVYSFQYGVDSYFTDSGEKLFALTYILVHFFSDSWNVWLFFVSSLIYIPLFIILKKESPNPLYSSLVFMVSVSHFFPESMNIIRQSIATIIILGVYVLWNREKKTLSLILLLVAVLFHTTSLIALPFLFLKNIKFNNKLVIFSLLIVTFLGATGLYGFINDYILNLGNVGANIYGDTMVRYSNYGNGTGSNLNGFIFSIVPFSFLCLITMPLSDEDNKYRFYFNILFVGTILYCLISTIDYSFRIVYGLMIIQIIILPYAYKFGKLNRRILIIIYTVIMIMLYLWYLYNMDGKFIGSIVPYEFF